ncbi:GNAT family N-acetyltransferase [Planctomycetota bacterium]
MSTDTIELVRRADGEFVEASLYEGMKPEDLVIVEREWGPVRSLLMQELFQSGVPRPTWPESLHWDWGKKGPELKLLESSGFGNVCEKNWQGVMLTKSASHFSKAPNDKGKPLVYIDYLEAAPWNWKVTGIARMGDFRGVGSVLFRQAVLQSVTEGFHGRVGLHALPQAAQFYEKGIGMTDFGPDSSKQGLPYFELQSDEALRFLDGGE